MDPLPLFSKKVESRDSNGNVIYLYGDVVRGRLNGYGIVIGKGSICYGFFKNGNFQLGNKVLTEKRKVYEFKEITPFSECSWQPFSQYQKQAPTKRFLSQPKKLYTLNEDLSEGEND
jgi:hypothetical protein